MYMARRLEYRARPALRRSTESIHDINAHDQIPEQLKLNHQPCSFFVLLHNVSLIAMPSELSKAQLRHLLRLCAQDVCTLLEFENDPAARVLSAAHDLWELLERVPVSEFDIDTVMEVGDANDDLKALISNNRNTARAVENCTLIDQALQFFDQHASVDDSQLSAQRASALLHSLADIHLAHQIAWEILQSDVAARPVFRYLVRRAALEVRLEEDGVTGREAFFRAVHMVPRKVLDGAPETTGIPFTVERFAPPELSGSPPEMRSFWFANPDENVMRGAPAAGDGRAAVAWLVKAGVRRVLHVYEHTTAHESWSRACVDVGIGFHYLVVTSSDTGPVDLYNAAMAATGLMNDATAGGGVVYISSTHESLTGRLLAACRIVNGISVDEATQDEDLEEMDIQQLRDVAAHPKS